MKLNEENGVKLEIKRSEINALEREYNDLMCDDESLKTKAIENIINVLPADQSIGIKYSSDPSKNGHVIYCFIKDPQDYENTIDILPENWIIEEDES